MKKIRKLVMASLVAMPLSTGLLKAEDKSWMTLTTSYKLQEDVSMLRFQRGTANTYGFLDIFGDSHADFESLYGEFRVKKKIGKGLMLGAEYNGGTGVQDVVRPQISYSKTLGPLFLDVKFSPLGLSVENKERQLGFYGSANFNRFGIEGWIDITKSGQKTSRMGEVELSAKLTDKISAIVRAEKYPWESKPVYSLGIKSSF